MVDKKKTSPVDENTLRHAIISVLSGIAGYKNGRQEIDISDRSETIELISAEEQRYIYRKYYLDGKLNVEAECVGDQMMGFYRVYHPNGNQEIESGQKGLLRHGHHVNWYDTGVKQMEVNYVDGERQGPYARWHRNGLKDVEATYLDNRKHGIWRHWNDKGELVDEIEYDKGSYISRNTKIRI